MFTPKSGFANCSKGLNMNNGAAQVQAVTHDGSSRAVTKRRRVQIVIVPPIAQSPPATECPVAQVSCVTRGKPSRGATNSGAHKGNVPHAKISPGINDAVGRGAQPWPDAHGPSSPMIDSIIELCRMRNRMMRAEISLILQAKAMCRSFTSGDKTEATKLYNQAAKGKSVGSALDLALVHYLAPIKDFARERANYERQIKKDTMTLAAWPWVAGIRGFGVGNFGLLVGEAGDIGSYKNPSSLWKRMGMAVIDGERQRKCVDKEKALIHGYSPRRRAMAFVLGDCLVKGGSRYRVVYDQRKAHTTEAHTEWTPKHRHNDAMRFMTKRVLVDLWVEWKRVQPSNG